MSKENNKFQTSEVEVAVVASVVTLPPVKIESSVDAAQARAHHQQHFATDHLLPNLRQRTISSGLITAAAQGVQFFLNLAYIMVLARLLTPQAFGLVAMVSTIMGFLRIFQDAGLSTATVQRQEVTYAQVSNLFWVNLTVGSAITLLVAG